MAVIGLLATGNLKNCRRLFNVRLMLTKGRLKGAGTKNLDCIGLVMDVGLGAAHSVVDGEALGAECKGGRESGRRLGVLHT